MEVLDHVRIIDQFVQWSYIMDNIYYTSADEIICVGRAFARIIRYYTESHAHGIHMQAQVHAYQSDHVILSSGLSIG